MILASIRLPFLCALGWRKSRVELNCASLFEDCSQRIGERRGYGFQVDWNPFRKLKSDRASWTYGENKRSRGYCDRGILL